MAKRPAVARCVNDSPTCITVAGKTIINYLICPVDSWVSPNCKANGPERSGSFFRLAVPHTRPSSLLLSRLYPPPPLPPPPPLLSFVSVFSSARLIPGELRSWTDRERERERERERGR